MLEAGILLGAAGLIILIVGIVIRIKEDWESSSVPITIGTIALVVGLILFLFGLKEIPIKEQKPKPINDDNMKGEQILRYRKDAGNEGKYLVFDAIVIDSMKFGVFSNPYHEVPVVIINLTKDSLEVEKLKRDLK